MRKFFLRGLTFSSPFLAYVLLIILIDPYNYFMTSTPLVRNEIKKSLSYPLNYAIWKGILYRRTFCPNILCGDSRVEPFDEDLISEVAGIPYRNLAIGGGTLPETCSMAEFAIHESERTHQPLRNVYIGLNFSRFHFTASADRVADALPLLGNPLLYLCNRNVVDAAWKTVLAQYFGGDREIGHLNMSREELWKYQLGAPISNLLDHYIYPEDTYARLRNIAEYCRENDVTFAFVLIPTHVDLQNRTADFNLQSMQARFLREIARLGIVYDFDYPNRLTTSPEDYIDPFHAFPQVLATVTREVWGAPAARRIARIYGPNQPPPESQPSLVQN